MILVILYWWEGCPGQICQSDRWVPGSTYLTHSSHKVIKETSPRRCVRPKCELCFVITVFISIIEVEWRIYRTLNWSINNKNNVLSPVRCQAITGTNADIMPIGMLETNNNNAILIEIHICLTDNASHNAVCKMVAISFRLQSVVFSKARG